MIRDEVSKMKLILAGADIKPKNPKDVYVMCCICNGDSYSPCEHLLKLLEE